jgi:hypothetical protein
VQLQTEETLIAQKMKLESRWNFQFLEQGQETLDMLQIEFELKKIKAKLRELAASRARAEILTTEEEIEQVDSIAS